MKLKDYPLAKAFGWRPPDDPKRQALESRHAINLFHLFLVATREIRRLRAADKEVKRLRAALRSVQRQVWKALKDHQ